MTHDPRPKPPARPPILRTLWRVPLQIAATVYFLVDFLVDDVVLAAVRPILARLAELRPFVRLAVLIRRLPPYPTLVLFLVPFLLLEPVKLWALWLVGSGRLKIGTIVLIASHLASIVVVERLFHMTRAKLLGIGWFARIYGWAMALYDLSLGRLRRTAAWRAAVAALDRLKVRTRAIVAELRHRVRRLFAAED